MIVSHTCALTRAHDADEAAGQIATRELERRRSALRRAKELRDDVLAAREAVI